MNKAMALLATILTGCGCSTTFQYLASDTSIVVQLDGNTIVDSTSTSYTSPNNGWTFSASSIDIDGGVDLPIVTNEEDPTLAFDTAPQPLVTALTSSALDALTGSELSVGQTFTAPGTIDVVRSDLGEDATGHVPQATSDVTVSFTVTKFESASTPSGKGKGNTFATVAFATTDADTTVGTIDVSGSVSYYLDRQVVSGCGQSDPCDTWGGCE